MGMALRITAFLLVGAAVAHAQHHHEMSMPGEGDEHHESSAGTFGAGVALVAASYDTMDYGGNYAGVLPSLQWSKSRFAVIASGSMYRLEENGALVYGFGDLMVHGQVAVVTSHHASAGVIAGVSAPTGDNLHGLGMGHVMLMPAIYGVFATPRFAVTGTVGYSRALDGDMHHDHGPWPLVEPMLMSELSWSAGADWLTYAGISVGGRLAGGIPIAAAGSSRLVGAARLAWHAGRVESAAELQAGLAGDPFTVRGVVSTALRF